MANNALHKVRRDTIREDQQKDEQAKVVQPNLAEQVRALFQFFRDLGISPIYFFVSVFCSSIAIFFNLLGIALLIPLLRGLIQGDFTKVGDRLGITRFLTHQFPSVFESSMSFFILILLVILASAVIKNALEYYAALCIGQQIRCADKNLRQILFSSTMKYGKQFFDQNDTSRIKYILIHAASALTSQLKPLAKMLSQIMNLAAYCAMMLYLSWPLTIVAFLIFPLRHLITTWLVNRVKDSSRDYHSSWLNLIHRIGNIASCIPLVKSYASEDLEITRMKKASDEEIEVAYEMQKTQLLQRPIQDINTILSLLIVAFCMTFFTRGYDPSQLSKYLVFFFIIRRAMPNFGAIANFEFSLAKDAGLIDSIRELLSKKDKFIIVGGDQTFTGIQKEIQIKNLSFAYRPEMPILNNVSFSVPKGNTIAIVGATGAGKSTLAQILLRFYDTPKGTYFLDGVDVHEFSLQSLAEHIAYVSQEPLIFNDTLRENLLYGLRREVGDDEIFDALNKAQLGSLIKKLPDGLETRVGDHGAKLSGGEKQRLTIARIFLKRASIMILDEATSALDTKTEKSIQNALAETSWRPTTIVITHRLTTVMSANQIIVLDEGRIVENGTWEELISKKGLLYEFWTVQTENSKETAPSL